MSLQPTCLVEQAEPLSVPLSEPRRCCTHISATLRLCRRPLSGEEEEGLLRWRSGVVLSESVIHVWSSLQERRCRCVRDAQPGSGDVLPAERLAQKLGHPEPPGQRLHAARQGPAPAAQTRGQPAVTDRGPNTGDAPGHNRTLSLF